MALTGEVAMQEKMRDVFQTAGKELKFFQSHGSPKYWIVLVDGKKLGENRDEATAFQKALDASGIGGKISYTYNQKKGEWNFRYIAKMENK